MSEDWFDVAYINDRAVLFGNRADQSEVDRELSRSETAKVALLGGKHHAEMQRLLRELAA